jgi:putative sugar O-methyltransferase
MTAKKILGRGVNAVLQIFGYQLVRNTIPKHLVSLSHAGNCVLPDGYETLLDEGNPVLRDLRIRYKNLQSPMADHTWWTQEYINSDLKLQNFRGDNAYVWQKRHMGEDVAARYYLYARDVEGRDRLNLLSQLSEDGVFGSLVYRFHRFPALSRDLLDSVNELNFLQRQAAITEISNLTILDIGAGYGRMAYRCYAALPNLARYYCTDAVPESTFVCQVYSDFRKCGDKIAVVPLDQLSSLDGKRIDIAFNIHSFSEMNLTSIEAWLDLLCRLNVQRLFLIPNDPDALLSIESDKTKRDFLPSILARGYMMVANEAVIEDDDIRNLVGVHDHMYLFTRTL